MNDYFDYEREKQKIKEKNLPPEKYEEEIRKLVERLKL